MQRRGPMPPLEQTCDELRDWFHTELGKQLVEAESRVLKALLPKVFGYHFLQLGVDPESRLYEFSGAGHRFLMLPEVRLGMPVNALAGSAEALPFANDCIDAVLLHHVLDFAPHPHQVLREAARVLRPGGRLIIVGFNPRSLWGLWRRLSRRDRPLPWSGHFLSHRRLLDWLTLLELRELTTVSGFYRPPLRSHRWMQRLGFLEGWGERYQNTKGAFLVVMASKEALLVTPLQRLRRRRVLGIPVVEPVRPKIPGHPARSRRGSDAGRQRKH